MDAKSLIDRFVAQSSVGQLVETLLSKSPDFDNADYLFRPASSSPVVAELKCLVEDQADLHRAQIQALYDGWGERKLVPHYWGTLKIEAAKLLAECQDELYERLGRRIKKVISKASGQIKGTKSRLGLSDAKGLLILVNEGNYSLESHTILFLVGRAMYGSGSAIDQVLYLTVNMMASTPITEMNALVWIPTVHPERQGIDPEFMEWLRKAWMQFFSDFAGTPIPTITVEDPAVLADSTFLRPPTVGSYYVDPQGQKYRCQSVVGSWIRWLAMEVPSLQGPQFYPFGQDLRHLGCYKAITDEAEIKRLNRVYNSLARSPDL
jgi:hypothetical protein